MNSEFKNFKREFPSMVSFLSRESKFFTRIPGGCFTIVCGIFFLIMVVIAVILHSLTIPVNPFLHFVSSMGIGPNGSDVALNVGLFFLGMGLYPFIIHLSQLLWMEPAAKHAKWNNRLITFAFVMAMISVPGLLMTAFFTMAPETILEHGIGAMLIFVGTVIFGNIFWLSIEWHKASSLVLRICSVCVLVFFGCMMGAMIDIMVRYPADFQGFLANPGQAIIDMLGNTTDMKLGWVRFFEWFYISSIVLWSIIMGVRSVRITRARRNTLVSG